MFHRIIPAAVLLLLSFVLRADEPTITNGLVLWFDASAQQRLREDASLPQLGHLSPVDFLMDGMTPNKRAAQLVPERRPTFVRSDAAAYLGFDGIDDFMAVEPAQAPSAELTVILLAAPKTNSGNFSALFGAAMSGRNDYTSGLNLDFGPQPTTNLSIINIESAGATGFRDLLVPGFFNAAERPFGAFHVFTARGAQGEKKTEFFLDGFKGGDRDRIDSEIGLDRVIIGGRFYSNDPNQPPYAQGFFNGAIAEILVYNRALSDDERRSVEQALLAKTVALNALLHGAKGHALEVVKNPPPVQMLVPGFTVEELPISMVNLNNVRYRHDGKLVGLGYDGRIYLLTDTDADGLEDRVELFWDQQTMRGPIGMALLPANDPRGDGVFVASKGKLSLFLDKNRDGRADEEKIVATGWPESFHGVDTLGVAIHPKDGSIYFGLGCANFVDAYMIDKATGRAHYSLTDIRGTIQKLSPDFARQETVCTGVRFTCALAFNREGDLFATDQEGATWLANGNPLDELLHIEKGKHYGFPPRHPKHLPDVRDEPAVIEYGPQHQSTVGLIFNEGVNGGPAFGPAHWHGDALVAGAARGKIWRTKLANTPLGYIAQNHLIACLSMITIDQCVTPSGDLIVVCHSGPPDWGTGPAGEGRIFRIRYTGKDLPQPVLAWAANADEFRVAFDRPLDPADWVNAREQVKIEAGPHVRAGDRFELIRPGYQVVRDQMATPRRWIEILGVSLTGDRRTVVIRVPRQIEPLNYAITLPLPGQWNQPGGFPQHPQIDLHATLNGVLAVAHGSGGGEARTILPHPSLSASAILTTGSAEHTAFLEVANDEGATVSFHASADLSNPFVPPVQHGSKIDWDHATDAFASRRFRAYSDRLGPAAPLDRDGLIPIRALSLTVQSPASDASGIFVASDDLRHRLASERLYVPWASGEQRMEIAKARPDVKGHWLRGKHLFFGAAGCATCHTVRGEGVAFGPDLSNLIHRDRESVLQDIIQPSAAINPDHAGTQITLKDGVILAGLIRSQSTDRIILRLPAGAETEIAKEQIAKIEPLRNSLMPDGLTTELSSEELDDLLAFLLAEPLEPAAITRTDPPAPPARRMTEVIDVLGGLPRSPQPAQRHLHILLCAGPKDHGVDEHDYPLWLERWSKLLSLGESVSVQTAMGFPRNEQLDWADVAVFYNANPGWNAAAAELLDHFHKRGGGAVYIHYAVDGGKDPSSAAERMGLAFTFGSRFRHGEFDLVFTQPEHPITRGFPTLHFTDETYWNMRGDESRLNILGTAIEDNAPRPELWTLNRYESRIVGCIPGHYTWTFDDPLFRILVFRGICWAAKVEDVDRLAELALIGARVQP